MTFKKTIELDLLQIAALSASLTSTILEESTLAYRLNAQGDDSEAVLAHVKQLKEINQLLEDARWQERDT